MLGRATEQRYLRELAELARNGQAQSVVVHGEPGIGKSTLLNDLAARADGFRVIRVTGVEFESDLPFAALTSLVRPIASHLEELPAGQASALRAATVHADAEPVNRITVYAAVLALLSAAAEDEPLICLVDDAQWIDRLSAEALVFTGRRLLAERVLLVFATRDTPAFDAPGLSRLRLTGLDNASSMRLLLRGDIRSVVVARRLAVVAGGNPLALTELPRALSADQRRGRVPLDTPLPTTDRLEQSFAAQVAALSLEEQTAVLVSAVAWTRNLDVIREAMRNLGLPLSSLDAGIRAGLISAAGQSVTFRHPLIRSAVYRQATPEQLRTVHAALAEGCVADDDHRAWYRANAVAGYDSDVAEDLVQTARRARSRGGLYAEALALERAAALHPDPLRRGLHLIESATAWVSAGAVDYANGLLDQAGPLVEPDAGLRCQLLGVRAYLAMLSGRLDCEVDGILAEARRGAARAPRAAGRVVSMAINVPAERWQVADILSLCTEAMALVSPGGDVDPDSPKTAIRLAMAQVLAGDPAGRDLALRCVSIASARPADGTAAELAEVLTWLGDFDIARRLLDHEVTGARAIGDVSLLVYALPRRSDLALREGRVVDAYADATESCELADAMAQPTTIAAALAQIALVEAALGRDDECAEHAARAMNLAPGNLVVESKIRRALGLSAFLTGDLAEALRQWSVVRDIVRTGGVAEAGAVPVLADLAEVQARTEAWSDARETIAQLRADPRAGVRPDLRAGLERVTAMLAESGNARLFEAALRAAEQSGSAIEMARTHVCYAQWLRRTRRRSEAARHARLAVAAAEETRACGWERLTREELAGFDSVNSGAGGVNPDDSHLGSLPTAALTAHEWRIAHAAAMGLTSKEIAARVLSSVRTVDYHLGNIYRKLNVRSRRDLTRSFHSPVRGQPASAELVDMDPMPPSR